MDNRNDNKLETLSFKVKQIRRKNVCIESLQSKSISMSGSKSRGKYSVPNLIIDQEQNEIDWEQIVNALRTNQDFNCMFIFNLN